MPRNFLVVHGGILLSPFVFRAGFSYAQKKAGISQSRLRNVLTFLHQAQDDSLPASPGLLLPMARHDSHVHLLSASIDTLCEFTYTVL